MTSMSDSLIPQLFKRDATLNERLSNIHTRIIAAIPSVDRVAVALYDRTEDILKTFISNTRKDEATAAYHFKLSDSPLLHKLALSGEPKVINEIQDVIKSNSLHSDWLDEQGYCSSFTLPVYDNGEFIGFVFFDSTTQSAFNETVQRDLSLYSSLINLSITSEFAAVRSIIASAKVARDFAKLRDFEIGAHLERMARYSGIIAKNTALTHHLSDEFVEHVLLFAPLHDIGKIGIPDSILLKPGKLKPEERKIMQTHVEKGYEIVKKILGDFALQHLPYSKVMINIVNFHHEYLDGSGYPNGLAGEQIPIEARIVTVADIFDALTSKRPYKKIWTVQQAFDELNKMVAEGKLDADCVAALQVNSTEVELISERFQEDS